MDQPEQQIVGQAGSREYQQEEQDEGSHRMPVQCYSGDRVKTGMSLGQRMRVVKPRRGWDRGAAESRSGRAEAVVTIGGGA